MKSTKKPYAIVHYFAGGTKKQYAASVAAVHPGKNRLPKTFEDCGNTVEAVAAGIYPSQYGIKFVGDAFLFGERGQGKLTVQNIIFGNTLLTNCPTHYISTIVEKFSCFEKCK